MTVRVRRSFEFDTPGDAVWEFISDPAKRADAISVVERYEPRGDRKARWHVRIPIPMVRSTAVVDTEDVARDPPTHVKFVGTSRLMRVTGEHTIEPTEQGCRLVNEFVVEGRIPGIEQFFERNLDRELDNLESALRDELERTA